MELEHDEEAERQTEKNIKIYIEKKFRMSCRVVKREEK